MSEAASIMDRYRRMPRAIRWALLAAIGIALFEVREIVLRPFANAWDHKAEIIEDRVSQVRASQDISREIDQMHDLVRDLGPVDVPRNEADGQKSLNAAIGQVLQKNGATNQSWAIGPKGNLSKTALPSIANGKRIERLAGDLKFDATPKAAAAIIAELESNPDIETVDSVRMTRDASGGKVKVHLTIEAWVLASEAVKGEAR